MPAVQNSEQKTIPPLVLRLSLTQPSTATGLQYTADRWCAAAAGLRPTTTVLYLYLSTGTYRPTQATPPPLPRLSFSFVFPCP